MSQTYPFDEVARLPAPGDNAAIATRRLERGTQLTDLAEPLRLETTLLEGHRFAVRACAPGEAVLSWGMPFGVATRPIAPGHYLCNAATLEALRERRLDFELPSAPNFHDQIAPYQWDRHTFRPGQQVALYPQPRTFLGYRRSPARGVGTRNVIVILGVTSRAAGYARRLAEQLRERLMAYANIDGVTAVAHTEGSGQDPLNNQAVLLRTLAGLVVHPNVGAVLIAGYDDEPIEPGTLRHYLQAQPYPSSDVPHHFLSLSGNFQHDLERGSGIVQGWLADVNNTARTRESLSHLKLALQCGGSDAFSGISGNPLAGALAREIIRYGGAANLAETDELMGAEAYILQNVRDEDTARRFLHFVEGFRDYLAWHGVTPESNPSGGNRYRGLYNIALKSLGAAMKRDPAVRLDYAVDYAEPMSAPGFYFMNTPGNDLESIAGQVAGGCNLIVFTTGNGSITNFPFVPTIKIVTTSARYQLLRHEMDLNAGAYLEQTSLERLTQDAVELTTAIASGTASVGERAGHSQISVWRNWRQTRRGPPATPPAAPAPTGQRLPIRVDDGLALVPRLPAFRSGPGYALDQIGLILPTSLCAGQVARLSAAHLNHLGRERPQPISRFVALVHTEGCGIGGESAKALYVRTLLNYMTHPMVRCGLFLEHGCEITHNDFMRRQLEQRGRKPSEFGWASIQLDGGLANVIQAIERWSESALAAMEMPNPSNVGWEGLRLGLTASGSLPDSVAHSLAQVTRTIVGAGGTVVVPTSAPLFVSPAYRAGLGLAPSPSPSLAYGQAVTMKGFHLMEAPSTHWVETLTGLGATGVDLVLAYVNGLPQQGHPFIPVIQITTPERGGASPSNDFDGLLQGEATRWAEQILEWTVAVVNRQHLPKTIAHGNLDFQITRGLLGVTV